MPLKPYKQQDVSTSLDMTQCSFQPFASNAGSVPRNGRNLRHKVVIVRADELRLHQYLHLQPTKFVQPMTYFDQIADAIYDGSINIPVPSIRLGLRKMGLSFPLMVLAAQPQYTKRVMKGLHHQKYFWHLHQGLVYVLWQESDVSKANYSARDWLCGEPQFCAKPEKFIHCLQNAILSFRSQEVKAIIHQNPLAVSFAAEMDTRRLALSRIQESITSKSTFEAESWQNALEVWIEIVVVRHQSHLNTLHRKFAEFFSLLTCDVDDSRSLANCFSRIQRDLHKMYSLTELRATVPLMVAELLSEFPMHGTWERQDLSPISHQALEWIEKNFSSPVSVAQCAASIPVSAAYLCRILQKETGLSPVQHLQIKRIAHAKVLLQKDRLTIAGISQCSGFGSTEHFYRVFHKHTNLTPAAYRRNVRKNG